MNEAQARVSDLIAYTAAANAVGGYAIRKFVRAAPHGFFVSTSASCLWFFHTHPQRGHLLHTPASSLARRWFGFTPRHSTPQFVSMGRVTLQVPGALRTTACKAEHQRCIRSPVLAPSFCTLCSLSGVYRCPAAARRPLLYGPQANVCRPQLECECLGCRSCWGRSSTGAGSAAADKHRA
jgi:hypothetical protein